MPRCIQGNSVDAVTGIPIRGGAVRVTQNGMIRATQTTGEPPGGLNTAPGSLNPAPAGQSLTYPYGFLTVPLTGPLT